MVMDVNQACYNHFTTYTNNDSLCFAPETNIMLYANYMSIKSPGLGTSVTQMTA